MTRDFIRLCKVIRQPTTDNPLDWILSMWDTQGLLRNETAGCITVSGT